ncbi:RNA polymerase sigma factor [Aquisphaera insulae]|uniref:RNA polymerase sigma factor n=1 Tax=Aquisphaera insulae TaxID=2712864 RepID=UPI0013EC3299|nr:sigma-70 family RNA polymerase sigma factor [Aquisphaera insulae]
MQEEVTKPSRADETPASLLHRLREDPGNPEAWQAIVTLYGPRIYNWSRRWGLQEADARDATQDVLLRLFERMDRFRYDPSRSFRAYLKTTTYYAWCDLVRGRGIPHAVAEHFTSIAALDSIEARDDLIHRLEEAHERHLLSLAMDRVSRRVGAQTFEAFRLLAVDGVSGSQAALQLGLTVSSVFVAKCRVQKMLRDEIRVLDPD